MRLTLDALQVLDAIDRHGSFAAAGEALFRVPSAITYSVRKLEEDLGVQVFDRSGRRAELTAAGRELLARGRHLLDAAHQLEDRARRAATGWEAELRIAVDDLIPMSLLSPLLKRFYDEGRDTRVRLRREVMGGTWDALASGRVDLAVAAPGDPPSGQTLATSELGAMRFTFALSPDHPLATADQPISTDALRPHRAVVVADSSQQLPTRSQGFLPDQPVLQVSTLADKLVALEAGLGVGFLPRCLLAPSLKAGTLQTRKVVHAFDPVHCYLAWQPDDDGRALHWFIEHIKHDQALRDFLGR